MCPFTTSTHMKPFCPGCYYFQNGCCQLSNNPIPTIPPLSDLNPLLQSGAPADFARAPDRVN